MNGKAEPRFDIDYAYGRKGELIIGDFLRGIADGKGRVEVKRKRYLDWWFYVETHCDKGRTGNFEPSGISVTEAEAWAVVFGDTGISLLVPTHELRALIDDASSRDRTESDGQCPTRGKLVNLVVLLWRHKQQARAAEPRKVSETVKVPAETDIRW